MDEQRIRGLMGLCVRAGQGVFGEESCLKALRGGQAALLIMDDGISPRSAEKFEQLCEREEIPLRRIRAGLLEEATGRPGKTMAIQPGSFAERLAEA